jgi:hypothetical protein
VEERTKSLTQGIEAHRVDQFCYWRDSGFKSEGDGEACPSDTLQKQLQVSECNAFLRRLPTH